MFNILEEFKILSSRKKEYSHPVLFDIHLFYVTFPYKHTDY